MPRRWSALAAVVLTVPGLAACGGNDDSTSSSGSAGDQSASPSVTAPTGSPFQVSFTGPELAKPGQTVTATLENTGRLPDKYQFTPDPSNAATITPSMVELAPGESVTIQIAVTVSPLIVNVADASAGLLGSEASISIGSNA